MGISAPTGLSAAGTPPAGDQANAVVSGVIAGIGPTPAFAFRGPMNLEIFGAYLSALTTTAGSLAATLAAAGNVAVGAAINSVNLPRGGTVATIAGTAITVAPQPYCLMCHVDAVNGQVSFSPSFETARLVGALVQVQPGFALCALPAGTVVSSVVRTSVAPQTGATAGGGAGSSGTRGKVQLSALPTLAPLNTDIEVPLIFYPTGNAVLVTGTDAAALVTGAGIVYTGAVQLERSFDGGRTWLVCNVGGQGQLAQYAGGTPVSITFGEPEKNVLYRLNCTAYTVVSGIGINYRISQTGGAAESLAIGPLTNG